MDGGLSGMKASKGATPRRSWISRFLSAIESIGNALPHPATLFAIFAGGLIVLSWVFSALGLDAVNPKDGSTVQAINLISRDGLHWILEHTVDNFTGFAPLGTVLVAMFGNRRGREERPHRHLALRPAGATPRPGVC
jgi:aminobenzoyl-glutamate transport protein